MRSDFSLRYSGTAVDDGSMDVYAAAGAMVAFSDFMVAASKVVYGDRAEATAKVNGFREGSFLAQLAIQFGIPSLGLFAQDLPSLHEAVEGAFALWKHLKGKPPRETASASDHSVSVMNRDGVVQIFNNMSLILVQNEKAAAAVKGFVADTLERPGIDALDVTDSNRVFHAHIEREEASWFGPVLEDQVETESESVIALIIESAVFSEGNKWKFFDGSTNFYAGIEDKKFLRKVEQGERFGKGDVLIAKVRSTQIRKGSKLRLERAVVEVLEHREAPYQQSFI